MTISPGGSEEGTIETGLSNLVHGAGPNVRALSKCTEPGYQAILEAAIVPDEWTEDAKASAVLRAIHELVPKIRNPRWRAAALAAFRLPATAYELPEGDSREGRWKLLAQREGITDPDDIKRRVENYRDYWRSVRPKLADDLEDRLQELNSAPNGWARLQADSAPAAPLPLAPPISFDRTEVLYQFEGYRGIQCTSSRWLRAHEPVDHYDAVGWYYNEPAAPVEIIPVAHCALDGPVRELLMGGVVGRLKFSHMLEPGEEYYFAYITRFNSAQPCRPAILYEVRGKAIRNLTVRVQFDLRTLPRRIWYFDEDANRSHGWQPPDDGAAEWMHTAPDGYVEHRFDLCVRGRMYGLQWEWPDLA